MNPLYGWQTSYMTAVIETDDSKRIRPIEEARAAMRVRARELGNDRRDTREHVALNTCFFAYGYCARQRAAALRSPKTAFPTLLRRNR
jgi:hypothetical protein